MKTLKNKLVYWLKRVNIGCKNILNKNGADFDEIFLQIKLLFSQNILRLTTSPNLKLEQLDHKITLFHSN